MPRIPEETVEQILAATDIVDLIESYIPLKRAGSQFRTLCPFHNEKTPSFYVNPGRQSYKCFGCGEGGSAVGFVMTHENLPFPDAIRKLARRANITIVEGEYDPNADRIRRHRTRLVTLHQEATEFMHQLLLKSPDAQHARDYLKSRDYGAEMAKRWKIGWMPERPDAFLDWARDKKFTGRELVDSGIAIKRESGGLYIRFRDRLMFPIRSDSIGDVIAFSGRQIREDPKSGKYINSPETAIFTKSKVFFALDRARKSMAKEHRGILCEGQFDVIACHEAGFENVAAALGTAVTEHHARLLKRYTNEVVICMDADEAGHAAADKAFRHLAPQNINVRVAVLPAGEDPDTFIRKSGPDAFRKLIDEASEFFDYKISHERELRDLSQAGQLAELGREMASLISVLTDHVTKDTAINHVATRLGIGTDEFREAVGKAKERPIRRYDRKEEAPKVLPPTPLHRSVAALCRLSLQSMEVLDWLCEQTESLLDAIEGREGETLLRLILSKRPDSGSQATINAFLSTLAAPDQAALYPLLEDPPLENPLEAAEEVLGSLSLMAIARKISAAEARMRDPTHSPSDVAEIQLEIMDLQRLIATAKKP